MSIRPIAIEQLIRRTSPSVIIDVRSPEEYRHAHYPGAVSLPLFDDDERAEIGTLYKRRGKQEAIKRGLEFFGPKMRSIVQETETILKQHPNHQLVVHCWRGGMRSSAVAWLLDLYGFKIDLLEGGYKKFRTWVLKQFEFAYPLIVLGGFTGSGKTEILKVFAPQHPVIDLEELAQHRGSAFGNLDSHHQDSTEQFENNLALALYGLRQQNKNNEKIWIESESSRIGNVRIPHLFFDQMKTAERIDIHIPFEKRLDFILNDYGNYDKEAIIAATHRIEKRLGGLNAQMIVDAVQHDDLKAAFGLLLKYYDKAYEKSAKKFNSPTYVLELPDTNSQHNAQAVWDHIQFH